MKAYRKTSGFTLVEILIVVIILGILAAIVIPQFTNASQDARKNSLVSQLQTIRSQLELYKMQHLDKLPPALVAGGTDGNTVWAEMLTKTNADHTTTGTPMFGPYLQGPPINSLNGLSGVFVDNTADYTFTTGNGGAPANPGGDVGYVLNSVTGKIWATSAGRGFIYNEADPNDTNNVDTP
jgi:general secretion pathway protein G